MKHSGLLCSADVNETDESLFWPAVSLTFFNDSSSFFACDKIYVFVMLAGIHMHRSFSFFLYGMKDECIRSRYCVSLLAAKRYVIINVA